MPKAFPKEFREDVIRVYKDSDASMAQVAKDFGISPSCLKRWLSIDERNSSRSTGSTQSASESDALREAKSGSSSSSRRTRSCAALPPTFLKLICRENEALLTDPWVIARAGRVDGPRG